MLTPAKLTGRSWMRHQRLPVVLADFSHRHCPSDVAVIKVPPPVNVNEAASNVGEQRFEPRAIKWQYEAR